jgi:hypothetical protein
MNFFLLSLIVTLFLRRALGFTETHMDTLKSSIIPAMSSKRYLRTLSLHREEASIWKNISAKFVCGNF